MVARVEEDWLAETIAMVYEAFLSEGRLFGGDVRVHCLEMELWKIRYSCSVGKVLLVIAWHHQACHSEMPMVQC